MCADTSPTYVSDELLVKMQQVGICLDDQERRKYIKTVESLGHGSFGKVREAYCVPYCPPPAPADPSSAAAETAGIPPPGYIRVAIKEIDLAKIKDEAKRQRIVWSAIREAALLRRPRANAPGSPVVYGRDVWAVGCMLFIMAHDGAVPFDADDSRDLRRRIAGRRLSVGAPAAGRIEMEVLHQLALRCLEVDTTRRPTVSQVLQELNAKLELLRLSPLNRELLVPLGQMMELEQHPGYGQRTLKLYQLMRLCRPGYTLKVHAAYPTAVPHDLHLCPPIATLQCGKYVLVDCEFELPYAVSLYEPFAPAANGALDAASLPSSGATPSISSMERSGRSEAGGREGVAAGLTAWATQAMSPMGETLALPHRAGPDGQGGLPLVRLSTCVIRLLLLIIMTIIIIFNILKYFSTHLWRISECLRKNGGTFFVFVFAYIHTPKYSTIQSLTLSLDYLHCFTIISQHKFFTSPTSLRRHYYYYYYFFVCVYTQLPPASMLSYEQHTLRQERDQIQFFFQILFQTRYLLIQRFPHPLMRISSKWPSLGKGKEAARSHQRRMTEAKECATPSYDRLKPIPFAPHFVLVGIPARSIVSRSEDGGEKLRQQQQKTCNTILNTHLFIYMF
eukprot:gene11803-8114_t